MFGSSGAHDLGYANAAVLIALVRKLIDNGTITKDQAAEVLDDAKAMLKPFDQIMSITDAINLIQTGIKPRVDA